MKVTQKVTRALAELYLSQGYGKEARDAYAVLSERFPGDAEVMRGLKQAQALVTAAKRAELSGVMEEWAVLSARLGEGRRP